MKIFPLDGQTRQAKSSSQLVNVTGSRHIINKISLILLIFRLAYISDNLAVIWF